MTNPEDRESQRMQETLDVEELVAANQQSNRTMVDLVDHLRKETQARDRRIVTLEKSQRQMRTFTLIVGVSVLILVLIAATNAWNIATTREQAQQVAEIARDSATTNQIMLDCVNQTGECGQQNTARQEQLLDEVKKYELIGFYCIRNNPAADDPKAEKFLSCMKELYPNGPTLDVKKD